MPGARKIFFNSIGKMGRLLPRGRFPNRAFRQLLPFYHSISDAALPHIRHLYQVKTTAQFEADLDFLLRHYTPIDYAEFQKRVANGIRPEKPVMLLSFDDGLREFHDVIAPILLRKGVPAICFLNSAFIDNAGLFYRYKASLLIDHFEKHPADESLDVVSKISGGNSLPAFLRSVNYAEKKVLDTLAGAVNLSFTSFLQTQRPYLDSSQIHALIGKGFHFGAHSVDHPVYSLLPLKEQLEQTRDSVNDICDRFSLSYKTFSFPFTDHGVTQSFFNAVREENIADLTFGCAGQKRELIPNHFQRIAMESDRLGAEEILRTESLYYLLKSPLGKNTIRRK